MKKTIIISLVLALTVLLNSCSTKTDYDICIYGGTASGVIAAYSARKMGKTVILIEPRTHLGGMTSGGLGATDIGNKYAVTGLARDFYRKLGKHYEKLEMWEFEPSVAENLLNEYIKNGGVVVLDSHRLVSALVRSKRIREIVLENNYTPDASTNKTIRAKMFIDCSYEGDLMATANVSYTLGREANSVYGETINGVQLHNKHQFPPVNKEDYSIDPYIIPGDSTSGLCWGISAEKMAEQGSGDKKLQAYNYRLCLTQNVANKVDFTRPSNYDSTRYELLRRIILKRQEIGWKQHLPGYYLRVVTMPNGKTDINNHGAFSTDMIGMNYDYPEAKYDRRIEIEKQHEDYIRGILWFLANDPAVPDSLRLETQSWGWCKDEFADNNHFPFQLYVREARRMISDYVMTEHHCRGEVVVDDAVGMAAYTMDSHNCQRIVVRKDGKNIVKNEGDVQVGGFPPYPISYRSIVPKRNECRNLFVPVCMSASHIAYGSIRMEPVFMVLGQSAAIAASIAIDEDIAVQDIDMKKLQDKLLNDPLLNGSLPETLIDNADSTQVEIIGNWKLTNAWMSTYKTNALLSDSAEGMERQVIFTPSVKREMKFKVYYYCPNQKWSKNDWATAVPFIINHSAGTDTLVVNILMNENSWAYIGEYPFGKNKNECIRLVADGLKEAVPADAIVFVPVQQ